MSCTIHIVSCNFAIHATCSLAFTMYKYNELQLSSIIQKLNCKASCKTPFFLIVNKNIIARKPLCINKEFIYNKLIFSFSYLYTN
jgi:hypothetical protein